MIDECLHNYAKQRLIEIERNYRDSARHCGIQSIHDLRVEIKRLRAVLILAGCLKPGYNRNKTYKLIKPLFKEAGKVRDIHVQMQTIHNESRNRNLELSEFYNTLKFKESILRRAYFEFCDGFNIQSLEVIWASLEKALGDFETDILKNKLRNCLWDRLNRIVTIKKQAYLTPAEYHQLRIQTKTARYILEVVMKCISDEQRYRDLNEGLKAIHQALGVWHDKEVGILTMQDFLENQAEDDLFDASSYQKYLNRLKNDKADFLGSFENRWGHFVKLLGIHGFVFPD